MLSFKKYSSIENHFDREYMERVETEMPQTLQYVVQEKVHGANTSFLCDGSEVRFAKRTSMLDDGEAFYNYQELLARYREKVLSLFRKSEGASSQGRYPLRVRRTVRRSLSAP